MLPFPPRPTLPTLTPLTANAQQPPEYMYGGAALDTATTGEDLYGKIAGSLELLANKNTVDASDIIELSKSTLSRGEDLRDQAVRTGSAAQWERGKALMNAGLEQVKRGEVMPETARQMKVLQNGVLEKVAKGGEIAAQIGNINTVYESKIFQSAVQLNQIEAR